MAIAAIVFLSAWWIESASAQSVCLPAPRLLTMMPMGGQRGSEVEVTVSGDLLDGSVELLFSRSGITAKPLLDKEGKSEPNRFSVSIDQDCEIGLCEARMMTRHGLSSSRVFSVGDVGELVQAQPSTSLESALLLPVNTTCNAAMPVRAVNHYRFTAHANQRVVVDCGARGIESKLYPVVIIADEAGRDLVVERRGDRLDFTAPKAGDYIIKVHELTFQGGPEFYYRLSLREVKGESLPAAPESIRNVNACSWPPVGLAKKTPSREVEPGDDARQSAGTKPQTITLPCDIAGSFFPAADVDTFEFDAQKGETWWVEVASERLGLPTDPTVLIQQLTGEGETQSFTDVAELTDIESPMKISTGHYTYDGPPYNAGSTDVLGKFEVKEDGRYRLQLSDAFGGTRNDPRNVYRLIVRKAQPGFALAAWALHMELRNGDRNALSKPIALRPGATMPIEVVAVRRDGFDGPIELAMEGLPEGVTAQGLTIPQGKTRGILLITAALDASQTWAEAKLVGRADVDGKRITRPGRLAAMSWPVKDARNEIPSPRLLDRVVVSVGKAEPAPFTLATTKGKVWEAIEGEQLTIPLTHEQQSEFSGANIALKTFGSGFEANAKFEIPLNAKTSEAVLDLKKLKVPPGDYVIAFYGSAVVKYVPRLASSQAPLKPSKIKSTDIVDIIVSQPISIRIHPADKS